MRADSRGAIPLFERLYFGTCRYLKVQFSYRACISLAPDVSSVMAVSLRILVIMLVASLSASICAAETSTLNEELSLIDQQLSHMKIQLSEVVAQMRDAKQHVAEKELEVAQHQRSLASKPTGIHAGQLQHAKQRLALAKMGVDAAAAKFERIQRRMEDLASERIALLASRDNRPPGRQDPKPAPAQVTAPVPLATQAAPETDVPSRAYSEHQEARAATAEPEQVSAPVLGAQGKLLDPLVIEDELQKLERHIVTAEAPQPVARNAKAFGSMIAGELALSGLGANQFYARFTATKQSTHMIVGARLEEFVRTSLKLTFTENEIGQEFILIFDVSYPDEPRAIVFQSSLMPDGDTVAAHQRF